PKFEDVYGKPFVGFDGDGEGYPGKFLFFSLFDLDKELKHIGLTDCKHMENMVDVALDKYNEIKSSKLKWRGSVWKGNIMASFAGQLQKQ
ncbi:unnamed protein product, partial [Thlaspi arvense]